MTLTKIKYLCSEYLVWYFRTLYNLLQDDEIRVFDYLVKYTKMDSDIINKFLKLYNDWIFYDIEHIGEMEKYDYIYNNWNNVGS